jgi:RNA polymerase primary sigma factor
LLDLADITVRQMIKLAKKRGYITYDELDQLLPPEDFSVKQIDDVIDQLCEMGIDLVEPEEIGESRSTATGREGTEDDQVAPVAMYASVFEGYWDGSRWRTSTGRPCEPTHWMPLPSPPLTLVRQ